jgi:hypothetical protein
VQLNVKVSVPAAVGVTVRVPVAARFPVHAPLAVQLVPAFDVHVTTVDWPSVMVVGFATTLTVALGIMGFPPPP